MFGKAIPWVVFNADGERVAVCRDIDAAGRMANMYGEGTQIRVSYKAAGARRPAPMNRPVTWCIAWVEGHYGQASAGARQEEFLAHVEERIDHLGYPITHQLMNQRYVARRRAEATIRKEVDRFTADMDHAYKSNPLGDGPEEKETTAEANERRAIIRNRLMSLPPPSRYASDG